LPAGDHQDGGGLILRVEAHGRRWVQRLTINGRRVSRGLGPYPLVTLQDARDKSYELRKAAREGRDVRAIKESFARPSRSTGSSASRGSRTRSTSGSGRA
jgi:Arm DNA-binding domain